MRESTVTVQSVIDHLEVIAPPALAAGWDNVGLLLGDRRAPVSRVMTCLTLTEEVAAEAVAGQYNLVVTHHPILFRGAKRITMDSAEGRTILSLAVAGIAVYSPHTGFDDGPGGINEQLAAGLGVGNLRPLRTAAIEECKLVVFVPETDLNKVADAIFAAGAGVIGQYRECSFRLAGTGTFFGTEATNPAIGCKGLREEVSEWRLEAVCPKLKVESVIAAMRAAHSYEEPAFDVYSLLPIGRRQGSGRVGEVAQPLKIGDFAQTAKAFLKTPMIQVVGDTAKTVQRVAIACGAAGEFLDDARRAKADVFVTGEMRFHDYLAAQSHGIALILPGHYATERFAVEQLAKWLQRQLPTIQARVSKQELDPVTFV